MSSAGESKYILQHMYRAYCHMADGAEFLPPMSSSTHYHIPPYGGYGPNDGGDVEEEEEVLDRRLEELQRELRHIKASPSNRSRDRFNHNDDDIHLHRPEGHQHVLHGELSSHPSSHLSGVRRRSGSPPRHVQERPYDDHQLHEGDIERLAPLRHSPPGLRPSRPHSPSREVSPSVSPPLPQESAWLPPPHSTGAWLGMNGRAFEEERQRLHATIRDLENRCHYYVNRLGEIENSNVDLERRLNDNMMDTMERIRQEHAGHRRAIEEKEHEIGVLRHECETERNVRNREVSNLKASLENEKRLLGEARAREEELVNECRIKISDLEADFASRERILVDQKEEMERSLRATIKRLGSEADDRCESFRAEEMVWEKLRGDTEGKLVELTADNSRLRQEVKELRAQLAEVQEKLRKAEKSVTSSPSRPAAYSVPSSPSFRGTAPIVPAPPWATHEGLPYTSAEHGSGVDAQELRKSWYGSLHTSPTPSEYIVPRSGATRAVPAGKPSLSKRLASHMDGGTVGSIDGRSSIIVRDPSLARNLSPSLSLTEQCRQLEQQLMHCNAERNAIENALNKYPTNSAGRTLNERIDKREKEQRLACVELAISTIKAKLRDLDAL